MQPSVKGQEEVMRAAHRRAGLRPDETSYVEVYVLLYKLVRNGLTDDTASWNWDQSWRPH